MANEPKFFSWWDIERVTKSVSRENPESDFEVLAWLRTYHLLAINFGNVRQSIFRKFGIQPRSNLGATVYGTLKEIVNLYSQDLQLFPQSALEVAAETLREMAGGPQIQGEEE